MLNYKAVLWLSILITVSGERKIGPAQDSTISIPLIFGEGVDKMMPFADLDVQMSSTDTSSTFS